MWFTDGIGNFQMPEWCYELLRQQLKERSWCDMWLKRKIIHCKYMELDRETIDWRKKPNNKLKVLGINSLRNICKHHNVTNISIYKRWQNILIDVEK